MREDRQLAVLLISLDTIERLGEPIGEGKVDGFVEIELCQKRLISPNCPDPEGGSDEERVARRRGRLTPWLKPAWYAFGNVTTNSPARWLQAYTSTPASRSLPGFMRVTSWKRRSG